MIVETLKAVYEDGKFRLLEPSKAGLNEGEQVLITVEGEPAPGDVLTLAGSIYVGLSEEEIDDVEHIALDREAFFSEREA